MNNIKKRNIVTAILLSIVTCGIYCVYWQYQTIKNTRLLQGKTKGAFGELVLNFVVPFYGYYWWFTRGKLISNTLKNEGKKPASKAGLFLVLTICGGVLICMAVAQSDFNKMAGNAVSAANIGNAAVRPVWVQEPAGLSATSSFTSYW